MSHLRFFNSGKCCFHIRHLGFQGDELIMGSLWKPLMLTPGWHCGVSMDTGMLIICAQIQGFKLMMVVSDWVPHPFLVYQQVSFNLVTDEGNAVRWGKNSGYLEEVFTSCHGETMSNIYVKIMEIVEERHLFHKQFLSSQVKSYKNLFLL